MKNKKLSALLLVLASPLLVCASPETDRKIEDAAKASYNYRTVLEDHVSVRARDGVVTLTGIVQDKDDKALAGDTVENLPGVTSVNNEIVVRPSYPEHSERLDRLQNPQSPAGERQRQRHGHHGGGQRRGRHARRHLDQPRPEGASPVSTRVKSTM